MVAKTAISVRIDPDVYEVLAAEAERNNRSITAQVEYLLTRGLAAKLAAYRQREAATRAEQTETE